MTPRKLILSLWLILVAMVSIVLLAPGLSSSRGRIATYISESSDNKIEDASKLSAAAATASIALSAMPGDTATPIAEKLAEFSKDILLILCVLYFEKAIFPIIGAVFFYMIIPAAVLICIIGIISEKRVFHRYALATFISGVLIWAMIPVGLVASDVVYASQQEVIAEAIEASEDLSFQIENSTDEDSTEDESLIGSIVRTVSSISSEMVEKARKLITGFVRSMALMIVTALVIPMVIAVLFLWLVKVIFQVCRMAGQGSDG